MINPDSGTRETCEYVKIPYDPSIDSSSDIRAIYEDLNINKMNNCYPDLYKQFLNYLQTHGLTPSAAPESTPCIEFPQMPKCNGPEVSAELHRAFTDLAVSLQRDIVSLQTFTGEKAIRARDRLHAITQRFPSLSSTV